MKECVISGQAGLCPDVLRITILSTVCRVRCDGMGGDFKDICSSEIECHRSLAYP